MSIVINGKEVSLKDIAAQRVEPATAFERETFSFIRRWQTGADTFTLQTSGSTGRPKTISFTRHQLTQSAAATIRALDLRPRDTALVCLHTRYIAGKMMLVRALLNNMKIVAMEPSANPLEKTGSDIKADFAAFVPLQVESMLGNGYEAPLNGLKTIIIGGAAVSRALQEQIGRKLTTRVYATYGMTETISHIALRDLHDPANVYTALPGVAVSQDPRGCLVVSCPYLDSPVVTNDLVELKEKRTFTWLGRADNVINTGGIKVIPEEIEAEIEGEFRRLNINRRFFIAGLPDKTLGSKIILLVEGPPLPEAHISAVSAHIKDVFSPHAVPREVVHLKRFNTTETGKISRIATLEYLQKTR